LSSIELSEKPYLFRGTGKFILKDGTEYNGRFKYTWEPTTNETKTTNASQTNTTTTTTTTAKINGKSQLTLLDGKQSNQSFSDETFDSFQGTGSTYIESSRFTSCETQFKNGKIEGRCVIRYPNGYRFEGEWKNLDFVSGKLQMGKLGTYEGSFKEGVF